MKSKKRSAEAMMSSSAAAAPSTMSSSPSPSASSSSAPSSASGVPASAEQKGKDSAMSIDAADGAAAIAAVPAAHEPADDLGGAVDGAADGQGGGLVVDDLEAKRRKDVLKDMEKIEKEFADLKEKLFAKKIKDLQDECKAIMEGSHEGFLKRAQDLEAKRNARVWLAKKWKEYQLQNIEHVFQFECLQAEEEFKHEKRGLRDEMANEILDKQKKLEEEKSTLSLRGAEGNGDARAVKGRVLRNRRGGKDREGAYGQPYSRHKTAQPPHINYTLNDEEIMMDLHLMKKRDIPPPERRRLCLEASEWVPALPGESKTTKLGA